MKLRLSRAHYPVTALGWGTRVGIWFQGCTIGCRGCMAVDTWDLDGGATFELDDLMAWCRRVAGDEVDGVTISGGEPFQQPDGLLCLLEAVHAWRAALPNQIDILCYSGMPLGRLRREFGNVLPLIDAVVPEPFVEARPDGAIWRGSNNQPLVPLTALGRSRYATVANHRPEVPPLQVSLESGRIWYIGVPRREDLGRVAAAAAQAGVEQDGCSWQA